MNQSLHAHWNEACMIDVVAIQLEMLLLYEMEDSKYLSFGIVMYDSCPFSGSFNSERIEKILVNVCWGLTVQFLQQLVAF